MTKPRFAPWRRRGFLQTTLLSLGSFLPGISSAAGRCVNTPSTEDGPLYPAEEMPWSSDLTTVAGQDGVASGQIAYLFGQVKNVACEPVSDATVEIWQADSKGYYKHPRHTAPEGLDPCFQYFGKVRVDSEGRYLIKTIVPSWYRIFDIERAAHIHMKVRSPSNGVLTSEVYFPGTDQDHKRETDPVYQSRRNKDLLIVPEDGRQQDLGLDLPNDPDVAYCRFDVMYRL